MSRHRGSARPLASLPIDPRLPAVVAAARGHRAAVVIAPPGSGKTTRVPPALLDAGLGTGRILVLQPRRVAARLAAARIAWERGCALGAEVGYSTRFERRVSRRTRIELITEGLLLRRLQADPFLEGVDAVLLDEFHERSLDLDLALSLLRELRQGAREDLVVVVMSATLDPTPIQAFLGHCPLIEAPGRRFPVQISFASRPSSTRIEQQVAVAVRRALREQPEGHLLVFLPGAWEIQRVRSLLSKGELALRPEIAVLPLHGRLSPKEQDRALSPSKQRKVVLATNIAETSVTLDDVRVVVDSGLARVPFFDPAVGLTRLETVPISQASADQRAGRAGRTCPGSCLRLWTESDHRGRAAASRPEIRGADLAPAVLQIMHWGSDPERFGWFEAPEPAAVQRGSALLRTLGALGPAGITPLGRRLAELPLHPRLARLLLRGAALDIAATAATVAALISGADPFREAPGGDGFSDLEPRLAALAEAEWSGRAPPGVDRRAYEELRRTRDQLLRLAERATKDGDLPLPGAESLGLSPSAPPLEQALLAGFPDRVAQRRSADGDRFRLASGGGAVLHASSVVAGASLVLAVGLESGRRGERSEARIRLAHALEPQWLAPEASEELRWDAATERVQQRRITRWQALVLNAEPARDAAAPEAVAACLLEAARATPERALAPSIESRQLAARLAFVVRELPELGLPLFDGWRALLPALCVARRSFAELRAADLRLALSEQLSWDQRQALDRHAPERLSVPSGSRLRIDYCAPGRPVLAARIQQLFGWSDTPRIARGRVPLVLHLLAPNNRPAQVSSDLAGFWAGSYAAVRKDLRGRYPKHSWPEDPAQAQAEDRPRRRRS